MVYIHAWSIHAVAKDGKAGVVEIQADKVEKG
jgi:hypothetical protein